MMLKLSDSENRPKQPWVKGGPSPNPGGRPAVPREIRERFRELTPLAIKVLENALSSEDERTRIEAAKTLLDRDLGRPHQSQSVELTETSQKVEKVQGRLAELTEDDLAAVIAGS